MRGIKEFLGAALLVAAIATPALADSLTLSIGGAPPPPPAPIVETIPVAPGPGSDFVWHAGHWRWIDEEHVWIPGHWVHRPHPRAEWVEPHWEQRGGGYFFVEGHWR